MKNLKNNFKFYTCLAVILFSITACKNLAIVSKKENKAVPERYTSSKDTVNTTTTKWNIFYKDANLVALIDLALKNNQELNIILQEISISKNEIRARKGAYLPMLNAGIGAGVEKVGRYTSKGASDDFSEIMEGKKNT